MQTNLKTSKDEGRQDFPKLELKKDETARIGIFKTDDWEMTVRHWVTGVGYVHCQAAKFAKDELELLKIQDEGGVPDKCPLCRLNQDTGGDLVGAPLRRIALRILRYQTDSSGKPSPGDLRFWMLVWVIDNYKYRNLRQIDQEWEDLRKHDLLVTCVDPQYQKLSFNPTKEALWTKYLDNVKAYLAAEYGKYKLDECLGQTLTPEALQRKLDNARRRASKDSPLDVGRPAGVSVTGGASVVADAELDDVFSVGKDKPGFTQEDVAEALKPAGENAGVASEEVDILNALEIST